MRFIAAASFLLIAASANAAFMPLAGRRTGFVMHGYLDDLSKELNSPSNNPDIEGSTKAATDLPKEDIDRFGPGKWDTFKDFGDEFDGGDGQMGVAGDGNKGLEKFGDEPSFAKSKTMSAKNAWGTSTGYAEKLQDSGMEAVKAQQMENWMNQQELRKRKNAHKELTESFDTGTYEEDWRTLGKFGVQRNQEFDLNETFGAVVPGDVIETIQLNSRMGQVSVYELKIKNEYMGFADFRAAFTSGSASAFSVTPSEGAISNKQPTEFLVKFKPNTPGFVEACLVIETEDMKKTWNFIGSTA